MNQTEDQLVRQYIPLVYSVASAMRFGHVDRTDLVSAGLEGLLKAVRTYTGAVRFRAYAYYCVRFAMLDEVIVYDRVTKLGRTHARRFARVARELSQRLGRAAEPGEIAERLGMSVEAFQRRLTEVECALVDEGHSELGVEEQLIAREMKLQLRAAMQQLSARERSVLELYYERECSQAEIGRTLGVTESRVCQIIGEAERDLRKSMGMNASTASRQGRYNHYRGRPRTVRTVRACGLCGAAYMLKTARQRYCGAECAQTVRSAQKAQWRLASKHRASEAAE